MTQIIDGSGRSTIAAAEGEAALSAGDTPRAREKFVAAGEILEREMRSAGDDEARNLLRFLAATQFCKGGHYGKALELASEIKAGRLPAEPRRLLPRFMEDVRERAAPDYQDRIQNRLQALWTAQDYAGIIKTLQEHPYVVSPANLAFLRAVCCEALGKYRPAVLFFADAARRVPDESAVLAALAPLPLHLAAEGKMQEAWEYVRAQLELFPNAVSYCVASLLSYHQGRKVEGEARRNLFSEQMQYFEQAQENYERLPPGPRSNPRIKAVLGLGYEAAAYTLYLSRDRTRAKAMCDAAIAFDPSSPNGWTLLGILTVGSPQASEAFKKAVELGDRSYLPFYFLAHDALTREAFQEGLDWSRQALERGERQHSTIRSLLYQWSAICLANLGGPREEIEALFKRAVEIAPDNEWARENYRRFRTSEGSAPPNLSPREEIEGLLKRAITEIDQDLFLNRERVLFPPNQHFDEIKKRFAGVPEWR
jgi:tetratricopeptide (TPR) repeat protein